MIVGLGFLLVDSVTISAWTIAALLPLIVAASRMYRGTHHQLDVTIARAVAGNVSRSSHTRSTRAHSVRVRLDRKVPEPAAVRICVPMPSSSAA
jgi:hypothetical protein